jgi:hypothetical protein
MKKVLIYFIFLFIFLKILYYILYLFFKTSIPYAEDFFHTGLYVLLLIIACSHFINIKKNDKR